VIYFFNKCTLFVDIMHLFIEIAKLRCVQNSHDVLLRSLYVCAEDIFMKTGQLTSSSSAAAAAGKWPLMTRAHLAQAVVSVALAEKEDGTSVRLCSAVGVCTLLRIAINALCCLSKIQHAKGYHDKIIALTLFVRFHRRTWTHCGRSSRARC
jgi:hypothetical protein